MLRTRYGSYFQVSLVNYWHYEQSYLIRGTWVAAVINKTVGVVFSYIYISCYEHCYRINLDSGFTRMFMASSVIVIIVILISEHFDHWCQLLLLPFKFLVGLLWALVTRKELGKWFDRSHPLLNVSTIIKSNKIMSKCQFRSIMIKD